MSMYVPEIVEEVSENAKMLVEDGGKIVRTGIVKEESYVINDYEKTIENGKMLYEKYMGGATLIYINGDSSSFAQNMSISHELITRAMITSFDGTETNVFYCFSYWDTLQEKNITIFFNA